MDGIFSALREAALTMQQGGGVGYDFSTLRPNGAHGPGQSSAIASGPVSFMDVWDAMCRTIQSAGTAARRDDGDVAHRSSRHRCVHHRQARAGRLRHFNLSVLVSDAFMQALAADADWALAFPGGHVVKR